MKIDLGIKPGDKGAELCCAPATTEPGRPYYPTLYLSFSDERLDGLPKEGTVTFKYKTVRTTESTQNGKESCSVELELHKILDVTEGPRRKPGSEFLSVGEALANMKSGEDED